MLDFYFSFFAGRLQLVRAVLFSIQAYWTKHFVFPKLVHKKIVTIMTRFLWKGNIDSKGGAKVAWENLCKPKDEGGLNIKNPLKWNHSQIIFMLWKVNQFKTSSLWAKWVRAIVLKTKPFCCIPIPTDCSWIW